MPVHGIEIDHGPMPANDALTFIIRASPAQGRDILAASHHLFRRDTRESLLDMMLSNISEEGAPQGTVHVPGDELTAGKAKAFGTLTAGET